MNAESSKVNAWLAVPHRAVFTLAIGAGLVVLALSMRGRGVWWPWQVLGSQFYWVVAAAIASALGLGVLGGRQRPLGPAFGAVFWLAPVAVGCAAYAAASDATLGSLLGDWPTLGLAQRARILAEMTSESLAGVATGLFVSAGFTLATLVALVAKRRRDASGELPSRRVSIMAVGVAVVAIGARAAADWATRDFAMLPLHAIALLVCVAALLCWKTWSARRDDALATALFAATLGVILVDIADAALTSQVELGAMTGEAVDDHQRSMIMHGTAMNHVYAAVLGAMDVAVVMVTASLVFRDGVLHALRATERTAAVLFGAVVSSAAIVCLAFDHHVDGRILEHVSSAVRLRGLPVDLPRALRLAEARGGRILVVSASAQTSWVESSEPPDGRLRSWPLIAADRSLTWAAFRAAVRPLAEDGRLVVRDDSNSPNDPSFGVNPAFIGGGFGTVPVRLSPDPATWDAVPKGAWRGYVSGGEAAPTIVVVGDGAESIRWWRLHGHALARANLRDGARAWQQDCASRHMCHLVVGVDDSDTVGAIVTRVEALLSGLAPGGRADRFELSSKRERGAHYRLLVLADRAIVERAFSDPSDARSPL